MTPAYILLALACIAVALFAWTSNRLAARQDRELFGDEEGGL